MNTSHVMNTKKYQPEAHLISIIDYIDCRDSPVEVIRTLVVMRLTTLSTGWLIDIIDLFGVRVLQLTSTIPYSILVKWIWRKRLVAISWMTLLIG